MRLETELTRRLGIALPILQAPMAGGGDTPELVAAVGRAGGMGSIGCAYLTAPQIGAAASSVRSRYSSGFGVNLFAPTPAGQLPDDPGPALQRVAPYYAELGLPAPGIPEGGGFVFDEQLEAALDSGASLFSFTFGVMAPTIVEAARSRGMYVMGTATNVAEAVLLERSGVDAVVAQGSEAGGHRGTFSGTSDEGMIGLAALVPQMVSAVRVPVIASGGIMDGRGIAAALVLGAAAVQLGTAFLTTPEAGIPQVYKDAILQAKDCDTRITRAFSGRPARGISNRFLEAYADTSQTSEILPFPYQNALTRPLRAAASRQGKSGFLSLWAGQGVGLARVMPAERLTELLAQETYDAMRTVTSVT